MSPTALRALRARFDLSREDLARMLRVTPRTVRRWERGLCPVHGSAIVLLEIMDAGEMPARYWKGD